MVNPDNNHIFTIHSDLDTSQYSQWGVLVVEPGNLLERRQLTVIGKCYGAKAGTDSRLNLLNSRRSATWRSFLGVDMKVYFHGKVTVFLIICHNSVIELTSDVSYFW
jgi:hypothetical protein